MRLKSKKIYLFQIEPPPAVHNLSERPLPNIQLATVLLSNCYAQSMRMYCQWMHKMLSYCRETALQGTWEFRPKVEDWNWETIFYGSYRSIFNHCDIIGRKIYRIRWKMQNKGYYGVQGHSRSSRSVSIESPYATSY